MDTRTTLFIPVNARRGLASAVYLGAQRHIQNRRELIVRPSVVLSGVSLISGPQPPSGSADRVCRSRRVKSSACDCTILGSCRAPHFWRQPVTTPLFVSFADARQMLGGIGDTTLRSYVEAGDLRIVKIKSRSMFATAEICQFSSNIAQKAGVGVDLIPSGGV